MRLWNWPLIRDFSGEGLGGIGLVVYGLGALSLIFSVKLAAMAWIPGETFPFVAGLVELGFNGSGGGARSGSELSHMGTDWCLTTSSLSREPSRV
ncbi:hypothetical protein BDV25DRAFT_149745 [Aspergillus avenaceus]|uniref:Uncharacterized protein n=1 Tax=Aspergillus avenaceus TaxID=36643 RepID=A0A5N6U3Q8_ASPAV|nr:hypothetical protein BDV25DRAFT_149745 [Aspergillus avenaceus]